MAHLAASWQYPHGDPSVSLFSEAVRRWALDLPIGAKVVELGCCETDFSKWLKAARPDLILYGIDPNVCEGYQGVWLRTTAEAADFDPASVDAVIALGSLEHFGLGFYGDPVNDTADMEATANVERWLKPGGWFYYDVPWTPGTYYVTENRHFRVYDDAALRDRVTGGLDPTQAAYANGSTDVWQDARPVEPMTPYWYAVRLLEKGH
jgi:SAM-dependent methyltransferase